VLARQPLELWPPALFPTFSLTITPGWIMNYKVTLIKVSLDEGRQ
jgi:hypothetical protein